MSIHITHAENYTYFSQFGFYGSGNEQFDNPYSVAVNSSGNVYVADTNNYCIKKFDKDGNFITKWGSQSPSWGATDGTFGALRGITVDSSGNVYVADLMWSCIQIFDKDGNFTTRWGSVGSGEGHTEAAWDVAVDSSGYVYVCEGNNNRIEKFDKSGNFIAKFGSYGTGDGQLRGPQGVAVDTLGNVFVADTGNQRIVKFDKNGNFVTKWGSQGYPGDGLFSNPSGVDVDPYDNVYVADTWNNRIQKFNNDGIFITKWGSGGSGEGQLNWPTSVTIDSNLKAYVADRSNHRIQIFNSSISIQKGTNLVLSLEALESKSHGSSMSYKLYYFNFGNAPANDVVLEDRLDDNVTFESASDGGVYDSSTRTVRWDIGSVNSRGHGYRTLNVNIPQEVPGGTIIVNNATISTSDSEALYDDNIAQAKTKITGLNLPANIDIEPNNGGIGTPSVYWLTPITFTYHTDQPAVEVEIRFHFDDGGSDIIGNMIPDGVSDAMGRMTAEVDRKASTKDSLSATTDSTTNDMWFNNWKYTCTFYPRHGKCICTFIVNTGTEVKVTSITLYIDPAGYIYDVDTGARIVNASVWLQRPDFNGGWENVPTGENPPISQPDINPLTTDQNGMYQWDVLEGAYRVHVEALGYEPANSTVVSIPPPVTDLHVGLKHINDPNVPLILPTVNFNCSVSEGYAPLDVQFTDLSENATGWNWEFGDGAVSTDRYPVHTYSEPGTYTVKLTASNGNGVNSKLATIDVSAKPVVPVFPGYTNPSTDPNDDGLYEDINGNTILEFDDVVAYYDNMDWIGRNAQVALFDFNKNGWIDFDDVVKLYDMV